MGDTIFALATPPGRGGVAVFRVSGPRAKALLQALGVRGLEPRRATRARFQHRARQLDDGLALFFPGPASFTGEDVAELHVHGGRAVCDIVAEALLDLGCRPAEPGEFTRRAFENGKMDLVAAEGLADLVAAETEAQRLQALDQAGGRLSALYESWRERLVRAMAFLEATIDFAEEDVPEDLFQSVRQEIALLVEALEQHLQDRHRGERLREGIRIALIGAPNSGKSTLLNRLAGREAAIVSPQAGTTRDVIEVALDLGGYPVILFDTAGIRDGQDAIEQEGIRRAVASAEVADIVLEIVDLTAPAVMDLGIQTIKVFNKADLVARPAGEGLMVAAANGFGVGELVDDVTRRVSELYGDRSAPSLSRPRHRALVAGALEALHRAQGNDDSVLCAEDLRLAARSLGRITGTVGVEDLLDSIFREFCIGK